MNWKAFALAGILLVASCSSNDDPAVDQVPNASDISGSVFLYNEGTDRVASDGMTVTVANVDPERSAVTDASGKFVIRNVPLGTHILTFTKNGYGTFKIFDFAHVTDDRETVLTTIPSLGTSSSTQVTALTATVAGTEVAIRATTNPAGSANNSRYVRIFLHTAANVSQVFHTVYSPTFVARINPFVKTYTKAELNAMGFVSGSTVFVRVYGDSYWGNQYKDPGLDRWVFPNLNPNAAAATSFVVP